MEKAIAQQIDHAVINGRNVWTYLVQTTIGDYYFTQYENKDDPFITDAYIGMNERKASAAFKRAVKKLLV